MAEDSVSYCRVKKLWHRMLRTGIGLHNSLGPYLSRKTIPQYCADSCYLLVCWFIGSASYVILQHA